MGPWLLLLVLAVVFAILGFVLVASLSLVAVLKQRPPAPTAVTPRRLVPGSIRASI